MCKIAIIAGIKPERQEATIRFIKEMAEIMTPGNDDGLGYAAVDKHGNLFAEKWLNNKKAFTPMKAFDPDTKLISMFSKAIKKQDTPLTYASHGVPDLNKAVAVTLHARLATSAKGIKNTHPFIDADTSLIHNGVITNVQDFNFTLSSCDSEAILISYLKRYVGVIPEGIKDAVVDLVGYYACAVFARDADGNRILDVFKGHNDNLHLVWIDDLETWVMSSTEENIRRACAKLGFKCGEGFQMVDGVMTRINPITGDKILNQEFDVAARCYSGGAWPRYNGATIINPPAKEITSNVTRLPNKNISKEEIEFLKRPPAIRELPEKEKWDYLMASGYYEQ